MLSRTIYHQLVDDHELDMKAAAGHQTIKQQLQRPTHGVSTIAVQRSICTFAIQLSVCIRCYYQMSPFRTLRNSFNNCRLRFSYPLTVMHADGQATLDQPTESIEVQPGTTGMMTRAARRSSRGSRPHGPDRSQHGPGPTTAPVCSHSHPMTHLLCSVRSPIYPRDLSGRPSHRCRHRPRAADSAISACCRHDLGRPDPTRLGLEPAVWSYSRRCTGRVTPGRDPQPRTESIAPCM